MTSTKPLFSLLEPPPRRPPTLSRSWLGWVAAALGAVALAVEVPAAVVLAAFVAVVSVPLVQADVAERRLPNAFTVPGIALVAGVLVTSALRAILGDGDLERAADLVQRGGPVWGEDAATAVWVLLGASIYGAVCALAWWFGGLGFGDVKLAALLGGAAGAVGPGVAAVSMLLAVLLAAGAGAAALMRSGWPGARLAGTSGDSGIPVGPAMIVGYWVALLVGQGL